MKKLCFVLVTAVLLLLSSNETVPTQARSQSLTKERDIVEEYTKIMLKDEVINLSKEKNSRVVSLLDKIISRDEQLFSDSAMNRLTKISDKYDIKPSWVILTMFKESGINPKAVNPSSNAVGIIQFLPSTAKHLGTSTDELLKMSIYEQLNYVDKYIAAIGKAHLINSYKDFYLAVFYPAGIGKDPDYTIGHKGSNVAMQNSAMANSRGSITVRDVANYARI